MSEVVLLAMAGVALFLAGVYVGLLVMRAQYQRIVDNQRQEIIDMQQAIDYLRSHSTNGRNGR